MADPFNIPLDLGGIDLWDPTKPGVTDPDPGVYPVKVISAEKYVKESNGNESIKVTVALPGGESTDLFLGLDFSKPGNKRKLATALVSCGIDATKLAAIKALTPALFMGRDGKGASAFIVVKLVEGTDAQGRKKLNDKEFATKDQAEAYRAALAKNGGAPAASGAGPAPVASGGTAPAADAGLGGLFN